MVTTDRITCFLLRDRGSSTVLQCQWLRTWDFTKLTSSFQFNHFEHHFHAENALHIGWVFCSKFSPLLRVKNSFDSMLILILPAPCSFGSRGIWLIVGFQAAFGFSPTNHSSQHLGVPPKTKVPDRTSDAFFRKVPETFKMAASVTWMHKIVEVP